MRVRVLLVVLLMLAPAVLLTATYDVLPPVPMDGLFAPGIGRCVALSEGDTLIGMIFLRTEDMAKQMENPSGFAISTYNAVVLVALSNGRPDLAALAVDLRIRSGEYKAASTEPVLDGPVMDCFCENAIWLGGRIVG